MGAAHRLFFSRHSLKANGREAPFASIASIRTFVPTITSYITNVTTEGDGKHSDCQCSLSFSRHKASESQTYPAARRILQHPVAGRRVLRAIHGALDLDIRKSCLSLFSRPSLKANRSRSCRFASTIADMDVRKTTQTANAV